MSLFTTTLLPSGQAGKKASFVERDAEDEGIIPNRAPPLPKSFSSSHRL